MSTKAATEANAKPLVDDTATASSQGNTNTAGSAHPEAKDAPAAGGAAASKDAPSSSSGAKDKEGAAGAAPAAAATYFPSQEVAIGTLVRSFIVDGVFRDHFPQLSAASTALPQPKAASSSSAAADGAAPSSSNAAASPAEGKVNVNEDGSTSHPPTSDDALLSQEALLATQAVARDLLQSLRQPADVPLYTRCSAYPNTKRRLLCHPDISPEEIRSTVPHQFLALFAVDVPAISLTAFAIRLVQRMHCGIDAFIWAIGLMFRVSHKIPVCSRSVHRMLLAATVISAKCRNDIYYSMSFYSGVGGVARGDLRAMEVAMLTALDFTAYLTPRTYVDLLYSMRQHCAQLTHTYKKAWASEAWAAFIVAVPLAHQAAFDPQAIIGPPGTPPHLSRDRIVIAARTKPHRGRDGKLIPAAGGEAVPNTVLKKEDEPALGPSLSDAAAAPAAAVPKRPKTTSSPTTAGADAPTSANIANGRDGRVPQGPAGSAFTAVNNGGAAGGKGTYAYYAATGDTGSAAGTNTDDDGTAQIKVYSTQPAQARHPAAAAGGAGAGFGTGAVAHPNANVAAAASQTQTVALNTAANTAVPIAVGEQMRQGVHNQHQLHPHRQASLQPITAGAPSASAQPFSAHHSAGASQQNVVRVTSPIDNADARSMHSSLQSFGDMAGDMSNSDASANMRVVGMGPIVRAVNTATVPAGDGAAQQGGPFFGNGTAHPSAVGAGGVVTGVNIQPNLMGMQGNTRGGRYVPSTNTSMNSFSDYTSSSGGSYHHAGGAGGGSHPRPTVMNVAPGDAAEAAGPYGQQPQQYHQQLQQQQGVYAMQQQYSGANSNASAVSNNAPFAYGAAPGNPQAAIFGAGHPQQQSQQQQQPQGANVFTANAHQHPAFATKR